VLYRELRTHARKTVEAGHVADTTSPIAVILTALPVEYGAVRAHLTGARTLVHPSGTRVERGRLPGTPWRVALAEIGEGTLAAATLTERLNSWLAPQALFFVGVAGGLKDDINIGDVVVATKVYAIHGGKQTPDGFLVRPEVWHASHRLEQAARHALRGAEYQPHFKPIAVGNVVLADDESALARHIRKHYNDAAAIEMEGAGVAQTAHLTGTLDTLIIRGISDKADPDKNQRDAEGSQLQAAENAAAAVIAVLRKLEPNDDVDIAAQGAVPAAQGAVTEARLRHAGQPEPLQGGARGAHESLVAQRSAHPGHPEEPPDAFPQAVAGRWPPMDRRTLLTVVAATGLAVANTLLTFPHRSAAPAAASDSDARSRAANAATDAAVATPLGQPIHGHTDKVYSVAFGPGGRGLASGSADKTVRFWDLTDPLRPKTAGSPVSGHTDTVYSVAFDPEGNLLADAGADQSVRLLSVTDPAKPVLLSQPVTGRTAAVFSVAFSPSGELLAAGSGDRALRLWKVTDPAHPELVGRPVFGHTDAVLSVAFSHDESVMGSGGSDHAVRLWNVADPPAPIGPPLPGHTDRVYTVAFSPNGHLLASGSGDRTVRLWKVTDPAKPVLLDTATGHMDAVNTVAFSPDGRVLASGSGDQTIRLWRVTESANLVLLGRPLTGHRGAVHSVAFSPDGKLLASGSADRTIRLWKLSH